MKPKIHVAAMMLAAVWATQARSQVILDMSLITCKQYLASDPDRKELIASWMGGYFGASKNLYMLDFRYVERNTRVVNNYCRTRKDETLMSVVQKNFR